MKKILVVEDNPFNLDFLFELLTMNGFNVDGAKEGNEAIQKANKEIYDLILMDIALPGIDGVGAMKIIKMIPLYNSIPIVAMTAFALRGDREMYLKAGFDAYISKPINFPDLMKIIAKFRGSGV
ncbi:MAG: response regulator [Candidatus Methanoperedens sp.]